MVMWLMARITKSVKPGQLAHTGSSGPVKQRAVAVDVRVYRVPLLGANTSKQVGIVVDWR